MYLQESMRSNLHYHSVFWYQAEALVEQHRAHQVVHMVVRRTVHGQWRFPLRLRDAGAYPARRTLPWLLNHLRSTLKYKENQVNNYLGYANRQEKNFCHSKQQDCELQLPPNYISTLYLFESSQQCRRNGSHVVRVESDTSTAHFFSENSLFL